MLLPLIYSRIPYSVRSAHLVLVHTHTTISTISQEHSDCLCSRLFAMATIVERSLLASQLSHHDRVQGCVAYESSVDPSYGYRPSIVAGIVFVVVFFLTMGAHCVQTTIKRTLWYSLFAVGALGKIIWQEWRCEPC